MQTNDQQKQKIVVHKNNGMFNSFNWFQTIETRFRTIWWLLINGCMRFKDHFSSSFIWILGVWLCSVQTQQKKTFKHLIDQFAS